MFILSYENEISFTCKLNSFSYEWLCTRPRFEREALGNSEMVYYLTRRGFEQINEKNLLPLAEKKNLLKQLSEISLISRPPKDAKSKVAHEKEAVL